MSVTLQGEARLRVLSLYKAWRRHIPIMCKDFDIPEDSEWASELIKEGFTLEFMKNALIRPILSLRNPQLLLDWWRKVRHR